MAIALRTGMRSLGFPGFAAILLPIALFTLTPASAAADDAQGPPGAPVMVPVYPAPLSQNTQTTYVPQSVALSGPQEITDVEDGQRVPAGYTPVMRTRRHRIVAGAVTLGVSYGFSALIAASGEDGNGSNEAASLWVPVLGPFLQIGDTGYATAKLFLLGMGGAQVAGAILLGQGLATRQRVFVRNDLVGHVTLTPMAGAGNAGMVLSGQF